MRKTLMTIAMVLLSVCGVLAQQADRAQSDRLFAEGVEKYRSGKYADALACFEQVLAIDQQTCQETEARLFYGPMWMAACHYKMGNKAAAEELNPQHYMAEPVDRRLTVISDSLSSVAQQLMAEGRFDEALPLMNRCAEMEKAALGEGYWYVGSCTSLGQIHESLGQVDEAKQWYQKAVDINAKVFGKTSVDYLSSLYDLSYCYHRNGDYQQASTLIHECQQVVRKTKNDNDQRVMDMLVPYFDACLRHSEGHFLEAVRLGETALEKAHLVLDFDSLSVAGVQRDLAGFCAGVGQTDRAIELKKACLPAFLSAEGEDGNDVIAIRLELASLYCNKSDYAQSLALSEEVMNQLRRLDQLGGSHYINCLQNMADVYTQQGHFDQAAELLKEALDTVERDLGKQNNVYLALLNRYGQAILTKGDLPSYRQTIDESLNINRTIHGEQSPLYADALFTLARYYSYRDSIDLAIETAREAEAIVKKTEGQNSYTYITLLDLMASLHQMKADYRQALQMMQQAVALEEKLFGTGEHVYYTHLNHLANIYSLMEEHQQALKLHLQVLRFYEQNYGKTHSHSANQLQTIADDYAKMGNLQQAVDLCQQALDIVGNQFGRQSLEYSYPLEKLSDLYAGMDNYGMGLKTLQQAADIRREHLGTSHPQYGLILQQMAQAYNIFTDYPKAIELQRQAVDIFQQMEDKHNKFYLNALVALSNLYTTSGDFENGVLWARKALSEREQAYGTNSLAYASNLYSIALPLMRMERYDMALPLLEKATEMQQRLAGENDANYQMWTSFLALCHLMNRDFDASEKGLNKVIALNRQKDIVDNLMLGMEQLFLAITQIVGERWEPAAQNAEKAMSTFSNSIYHFFGILSKQQREAYWSQYRALYEEYLPKIAFNVDNDRYNATLYDAQLLSKGLLLNTEIEVNQLIRESGDTALVARFDRLQSLRQTIDKLRQMPEQQRVANVDELQQQMVMEEQQLARLSSEYGDYTARLRTTWQQVKQHLGGDAMAVEFIHADNAYAALCLFPWSEKPQLVGLFTDDELAAIPAKDYYTTTRLYDLIWRKMSILPVTKNIYFAPAGELHNIAIEYLPVNADGATMASQYAMYRLSSTREVVFQKTHPTEWRAVLYGGLEYDADPKSLSEENRRNNATRSIDAVEAFRNHLLADSLGMRSGVVYLEGTLREVEAIDKTISGQTASCRLYTEMAGTEETIKNLSGKPVTTLHIATHGFYWPESQKSSEGMLSFMQAFSEGSAPQEDKALTRSGLLFAGANNVFNGIDIPQSQDDGVLTARELSLLDLRHTDLVVLSACQTALGKITGDGVFGLQRGFKKAGAKTLLMSLWKVDDHATQLLMTEFYRNLTAGQSKRKAFIAAQQHLRQCEGGKYDKPEFWAAFILLDATE